MLVENTRNGRRGEALIRKLEGIWVGSGVGRSGGWRRADMLLFETQIKLCDGDDIMYLTTMNVNVTNASKRGWLPEEDQLLQQLVAASHLDKLKWVEVSKTLHEKLGRLRTGKQCRERWQHQLNPSIVRVEWTETEQLNLFELQSTYGNKWAQIAEHLPGRTDNAVKNFFYSAVRRVFTKVNMYLGKQKSQKQFRSIREFETDFLSKLMAVVDGNFGKKLRLTNNDAILYAKQILASVAVLSAKHESQGDTLEMDHVLKTMVIKMHEFRKCCKKRKQRRSELAKQDMIESEEDHNSSRSSILSGKSSKKADECAFGEEMKDERQSISSHLIRQIRESSGQVGSEDINTSGSIELSDSQESSEKAEPAMFKVFSGADVRNDDKWWEVLQLQPFGSNPLRVNEESAEWEWRSEDMLPWGNQREDILGESQIFDSNQIVTKFKMLEASIALEDLLLTSKKSSFLF